MIDKYNLDLKWWSKLRRISQYIQWIKASLF
jgi:hypothetical protein